MYQDARDFIDRLGGYRAVARRMAMKPTTLHSHISSGVLPSRWYDASCALASEMGLPEPQRSLFSFEVLPNLQDLGEDAA